MTGCTETLPATAGRRANQRRDKRHLTVLIIGKVRGAHGEYACVVNDVSRGGLKARFPYPPQVGERLTLGLRGLPDLTATVRWTDGLRGGVEFDAPIDVAAILTRFGSDRTPRAPRFTCNRPACLIVDGHDCAIDVIDVSLGGAKLGIEPIAPSVVGHVGTLILPTLGERRAGTIRWGDGERVGFQFARPLTLDALAGLLASAPD